MSLFYMRICNEYMFICYTFTTSFALFKGLIIMRFLPQFFSSVFVFPAPGHPVDENPTVI